MAFDRKRTASELIKLADAIEKQAAEKTYFVCDCCNHTANLASINSIRTKVASENGIESVSPVNVNNNIACPVIGCEGRMSYVATSESDKYYVEVSAAEEDVDFDLDVSEDSPEQDTKGDGVEEESLEGEGESNFEPVDEQEKDEDSDDTEGSPEDEGANAESPLEELIEEEIEEEKEKEPKKKKPRKKKDKADDEKAVPKFTEMPEGMKDLKMKAASERFYSSVSRYSNI